MLKPGRVTAYVWSEDKTTTTYSYPQTASCICQRTNPFPPKKFPIPLPVLKNQDLGRTFNRIIIVVLMYVGRTPYYVFTNIA